MADPNARKDGVYAEHAIYVETLEKVAESLSKGLALWLKEDGKPETLVTKGDLKVLYE